MTIPLDVHQQTANYKGKARTTKTTGYGAFKKLQENYLKEGNYKETIWNAIKTNWIPYIRYELKEKELRRQYKTSIKDYIAQYSNLQWADKTLDAHGNRRTVISKDAAMELIKRLNRKLSS